MSHLPNSTFDPNSISMFPFKPALLFLEKIAQRIEIIRIVTKKKKKKNLFIREEKSHSCHLLRTIFFLFR